MTQQRDRVPLDPPDAPASPSPRGDGHDTPSPRTNWPVLVVLAAVIVGVTVWSALDPDGSLSRLETVVTWVSRELGWWYIAVVAAVLLFVVVVALSSVGRTRLGPDHSRPRFSMFTWTAMLFAAGIGIDLMFFSVAEPVTQFLGPPSGEGGTTDAARMAVVWTLFHYGLMGWGLYALLGMAFAYFAYRKGDALSIRSALRPLLGDRVDGPLGDAVDVAALLGAIFGIATSLGIGVVQLNFGLDFMFGWPQNSWMQAALIGLSVLMAVISVTTGVERGIRRLSELNIVLAVALMVFVLVTGPTTFLMDGLVTNVGDSIAMFPSMALDTFAYDRPDAWMSSWTLFFWAWWIAWAPFVGLFLARISRGRTIREFVLGVLIVPFTFIAIWISIFGNSALDVVRGGDAEFGETAVSAPESAFYSLLDNYPWVTLLAAVATFTGLLFYVTSADSGALVMANFSSRLPDAETDAAPWLRVFWAVVTGALTLAILGLDGVTTLQYATLIVGIPFSVVVVLVMIGLWRALQVERTRYASVGASLPSRFASRADAGGDSWQRRLRRATSYPSAKQARRFVDEVALPALESVRDELVSQGGTASVASAELDGGVTCATLRVTLAEAEEFSYEVRPVQHDVPSFARIPSQPDRYYRVEPFSPQGSDDYDLLGCSEAQVIADVLDHYEAHLEFLRLGRVADNGGAVPTEEVT